MKFPPPHHVATESVARNSMAIWRRDPESNRTRRICNPIGAVCVHSSTIVKQALTACVERLGRSIRVQLGRKIPPLLALLLTACGGGGSSVPPAEPGPTPTIQASAYGDSTQEAQGQPHAASRPGAYVYNRGVGGTNTTMLLTGTDGRNYVWPEQMSKEVAPIVVINHGINDRGYPLEVYKANLRELITVAQANGKIVILEVPNPAGETETPLMAAINFDVPAFEARRQGMRDVAVHMGVYLCEQPRVPLVDGIHPTTEGYATKAGRLAVCIADVL